VARFLLEPFQAPYMQRALVETLLLAVLAGVVSVHVVLRRLSFLGDALTHTIFPGIAVAFVLGQSLFLGALVAGLVSAVLLTAATRVPRIDTDAALGVLLGAFFSAGVIVVSTRRTYTADLTALLFGRILTVDRREIIDTAVVLVVVLLALAFLHKELVFRAFDPAGAEALGFRVALLDLVLNALVALVVVAAVRAVGTVLVIALIVVPAATARLVTQRVASMLAVSCLVAVCCGYVGLATSYEVSLHHGVRLGSGATIVVVLTVVFAGVAVAATAVRAWRRHPVTASDAGGLETTA
jgi:manganese/iron transport system permease protein